MKNPTRTTLMRRCCPALIALAVLLAFCPISAAADPVSGGRGTFQIGTTGPVPEGAHVTLKLDKAQYLLGENILLHIHLENDGDTPFTYDNKGTDWDENFVVSAVGSDGRPVAAPAHPIRLDVAWSRGVLKPGGSADWSLSLTRYCVFELPGRYVADIRSEFGWAETPGRKNPAGTIALTLRMPTPAQARGVLEKMDAPPAAPHGGEAPTADFSALRCPVYLPLLRQRAQATTPRAFETSLQGIGAIPTPAATLTLLELACNPDPTHGLEALQTLNERLPDPPFWGEVMKPYQPPNPTATPRYVLSRAAWRDAFAPPARALARRLLTAPDPYTVAAAFTLECVGTVDDLPALTAALDTAIRQVPRVPIFQGSYPRSYGACAELERATLMRLQTGATVPGPLDTAAAQDEYLQALTAQPSQRPADWPTRCLFFLDSPVPYLRARTLATLAAMSDVSPLPPSITDALRRRLPALLLDQNEDIQVGACALAIQIKAPALLAPTLQALTEARDFPLPNDLTRAAIFQGGRWEALQFWADHLDDPARKQDALGFVQYLLEPRLGGGYTSNYSTATATALKTDWDRFLVAHRPEIEAGKTYSLDNPEVTGLFPPKIFSLGSGSF
jgi:hypothetical protein